jgi:hypothetical protein
MRRRRKTNDLFEVDENPNFIEGIFNYCDRWCERCSFTSRCRVYAMEQERGDDLAAKDITNEAFWQRLHDIFQQTRQMLYEMAEEQGIDIDATVLEYEKQRKINKRAKAKEHPLTDAAMEYAKFVSRWFEQESELIEKIYAVAKDSMKIGVREFDHVEEKATAYDAVQIIQWYQFQIGVKIMRAVGQADEDIFEEEALEEVAQKDSDGSIKVALTGIDRSIAAWGSLQNNFPEKRDSILQILVHLENLRRKTEQSFPNARKFIRPGFDTLPDSFVS